MRAALEKAEEEAAAGNWVVGMVAYDAAPGLDPHLRVPGRGDSPLVWFGVYPGRAELEPEGDDSAPVPVATDWEPSMSAGDHQTRVERIRQLIREGHTYQVNLTMKMSAGVSGPTEVFEAMVAGQPESYAGMVDLGDRQVVSVSPELFLAVSGDRAVARPMKGTAPRGRWPEEDRQRRHELVASEKEQAGNVMIVDMLRNDLGRVSVTGGVSVPELFVVERHPTLWQMTSTIESELEPGVGLSDLFAATFPSASVTGAPKVSTMGIIADLETGPRGFYCGAIGYLRPGGEDYEFSVAIRTGVVSDGRLEYGVGGGITVDSDPAVEYAECLWKALVITGAPQAPDLLESMRYQPGSGIPLLEGHMRRLAASADYWAIPFDPSLVGEALSVVEGPRPLKVRLTLYRHGEVAVTTEEIEEDDTPVVLSRGPSVVDPDDRYWFHKTLERSRYPPVEGGEVVLSNISGEITETSISNLMARIGGRWVTPPLEAGCLPGVYREKLLRSGEIVEQTLTWGDLEDADELAVTNAVRGWRKAVLASD